MESGIETSLLVKSERRRNSEMVRRVLGKVTDYLSDDDESNFPCW